MADVTDKDRALMSDLEFAIEVNKLGTKIMTMLSDLLTEQAGKESSPERAFDMVFNAALSAAVNFATEVGVSKDEVVRVLEVAAEQMRSGAALRRGKRVHSSGEGN